MVNYFLSSARLGFRLWHKEDLELALFLWGDNEVTKFIGGSFTNKQVEERLLAEIKSFEQYKVQYWPFFLLETDEHVGCCGLRPYKLNEGIYELGFHLRGVYWGKGYAKEAALAVITYAFDKLKVNTLFAGHNPNNEASRMLLEKLGFSYTHDEYYMPTGLYHPSYALKKDKK